MTDGGLRVVERGYFGVLCCGVGAGTKGTGATAKRPGEASSPGPTEPREWGGYLGRGVAAAGRGRARAGVRARRVRPGERCACL
jgi:hypothetical protein